MIMPSDRARRDETRNAGEGDQIAQLVLAVLDRKRTENEAEACGGEVEISKLDAVRQLHADHLIALHAGRDQALAHAIDIGGELVPAQPERLRAHEQSLV